MLRDVFLRSRAEPVLSREMRGPEPVRHVDHQIAEKAAERHGVVTRAQLLGFGLGQDAIDHRARIGRLHRLHPGVFAVGHAEISFEGRCLAAVEYVAEGGGVASVTALALHDIRPRRDDEPVHLAVSKELRREGLRVHVVSTLTDKDFMLRAGVRVLFPTMSLLTAACDLGEKELRRAVNQALVLKRVSIPGLVEVIARNAGRRGVGKLARVLASARPTRSDLEDAAVAMLDAYGFGEYETNARIGSDELDVHFPRAGLVLELDGAEFHDNPIARADDAAKQARLEARGLRVERPRWRDVTVGQAALIARLATLGVEPVLSRDKRG